MRALKTATRKSRRCRLPPTDGSAIATSCCAPAAPPALASVRSSWPAVAARVGGRVAIPGERTTAALLLRLLGRFETVAMRFDQIEDAVLCGDVDCGVLIHEGRFTYEAKGLTLLPISGNLGGADAVAAATGGDRDPPRPRAGLATDVDRALRASVDYAFEHPDASRAFVAAHAQEMDPDVMSRHIQLYVNDYTRALDEHAVQRMLTWAGAEGFFAPAEGLQLFV